MDQCYGVTCSIKVEDLLKIEFPSNYSANIVLKILQSLFVQEIAFLDGASYLESTHQCIFMWEGAWKNISEKHIDIENSPHYLEDRIMLSYAKSLDKSLSHVTRCVMAADIYEGKWCILYGRI